MLNLHSDIRAFKPDGSVLGKLQGLEFCNIGDFDPDSNGKDVWTSFRHYKMHYSTTVPGGEWPLHSVAWNPFLHGSGPANVYNSCSIFRRLGPDRKPFVFAAGQGFLGDILIRRLTFQGLDPHGVPRYTGVDTNIVATPCPPDFLPAGGFRTRIRYQSATDSMYFMSMAPGDQSGNTHTTKLIRMDEATGSYYILTENSGYNSKQKLYRWKP